MIFRTLPCLFAALLALTPEAARAQLSWKTTERQFKAADSQRVVTAEYPFMNTGAFPVRIRDIRTNCGCTAGRPDKELIAPGEAGVISVAFNIENRKGRQEKKITVKTDDPASDAVLWLRGEVFEGMTLRPMVLRWKPEEAGVAKTATLTVPREFAGPVEAALVEGWPGLVDVSLTEAAAGQKFEIRVTPKHAFAGRRAAIALARRGTPLPPVTLHLSGPR